jgi:hypothetical protein
MLDNGHKDDQLDGLGLHAGAAQRSLPADDLPALALRARRQALLINSQPTNAKPANAPAVVRSTSLRVVVMRILHFVLSSIIDNRDEQINCACTDGLSFAFSGRQPTTQILH